MTEKENMDKLTELVKHHHQLDAEWFRHLLTLAVGPLVLLGSFVSDSPASGLARCFLARTWVSLYIGILSGTAATYLPVNRAEKLMLAGHDELMKRVAGQGPTDVITVTPSMFFVACRYVMMVFLLLAMICLTGYSVTMTLSA